MAKDGGGLFETLFHQRVTQRWARAASRAERTNLSVLRRQRESAQRLKPHLDRFLRVAEDRLALPAAGGHALRKPAEADWVWRPDIWRFALPGCGIAPVANRTPLDDQISLFHDCPHGDLVVRQLRDTRREELAPYALRVETFGFAGSFLSVAIDLPAPAITGLGKSHLIRLDLRVEYERPVESFARLNIRHGPNTEQLVERLPSGQGDIGIAFDLAYSALRGKPVDQAWIDVIFENPAMTQIILRDLTVTRCARATF